VHPGRLIRDPDGGRIVADRIHDPSPDIGGRVEDVVGLVAVELIRRSQSPQPQSRRDREDEDRDDDTTRDR
jgi:hypothetical protein